MKAFLLIMTAWLLSAAVARPRNRKTNALRITKCSDKSSSIWRKKTPEPSSFTIQRFSSPRTPKIFTVSRATEKSRKKIAVVCEVESIPFKFDSLVSSDHQAKMFRDAAYVLSMRSEVGHANGKKFHNQFLILRVYVNNTHDWKVFSQPETKLPTDASRQ